MESKTQGTVKECSCEHEYQDKRYGKSKRFMNPMKSGYRCTVCAKVYNDK